MKEYLQMKGILCSLLFSTTGSLWAQKMEFYALNKPFSAVRGITNEGKVLTNTFLFDYTTKEIMPKEPFISAYISMNQKGQILAMGNIDGQVQPIYKLSSSSEWEKIRLLPEVANNNVSSSFISPNGKYIVGQMASKAYIYDTTTKEIENLSLHFGSGAGYTVNSDGLTGGWVDTGNYPGGTFRQLALMEKGPNVDIILKDIARPINNEIRYVGDDGTVLGAINKHPFSYNIHTKEYVIYDLPIGYNEGIYGYASNGIYVGFVQNSPADREAIIFHPSLGSKPKLIRDLLQAEGIPNTVPGGKLGAANVISDDGQFIGGMEIGNGNLAAGWIIKLNGFFNEQDGCQVNIPDDISVQAAVGQHAVIVDYHITSNCPENKLILTKGYASGEAFPLGITEVSYDLVDTNNHVVQSVSFKIEVKDFFCTPRFANTVEPITKVKFGSINNVSPPDLTENQNEYFLDHSTDIKRNGVYEISVEGNTNGKDTNQFVVFFDFNQDNEFTSDEGYYIGSITNSTGTDGKNAVKTIKIPVDAFVGQTRMRVVKVYNIVPQSACGTTYAYGQSEDYTVNVVEEDLGLEEKSSMMTQIYPNPVNEILSIKNVNSIQELIVYNMAGQQVAKGNKKTLSVAHLVKGTYVIKIITAQGIEQHKFIKK